MRLIKTVIASLSMYSRLPMPCVSLSEEDTGHIISALPLTGIVIGAFSFLTFLILLYFDIPVLPVTLILMTVPILVTGGFHADGFMDVKDALNSGLSRDRKIEIMKDPHIGAFAVISILITGVIWLSFLYVVVYEALRSKDYSLLYIYFLSFYTVRALCGLSSLTFKKAKKDGMLNMETKSGKRGDIFILGIQALTGAGITVYLNMYAGSLCLLGLFLFTYLYKRMCIREFGGVTGDTAGYFVVAGERTALMIAAFYSVLGK